MKRLLLVALVVVGATFCASSKPASADPICYTGNLSAWTTASAGLLYFYPLCNSSGALVTSGGGGGGSFTPPYSAALGQTAQANSFLGSAAAYYATAPTLTNGQVNPLLVDSAGNLKVVVQNTPAPTPTFTPAPSFTTFPAGQSVIGAVFGYDSVTPAYRALAVGTDGGLILSASSTSYVTLSGASTVTANAGSGFPPPTGPGTPPPYMIGVQGNSAMTPLQVICASGCSSTGASPYPTSSPGGVLETTYATASGTPTTQPVTVSGSVAVTGTFYQATQPVSGAFYQATQPVSLAALPSLAAGSAQIGTIGNTTFGSSAVTGNGFTHYAATSVTSATAAQIGSGALTLASLTVTWNAPSTVAGCWLTLYNNATTPTVGSSFVSVTYLNTATPSTLAIAVPPTIGGKISSGLWYAITTAPTGSTACNTTASELWVESWYV